MKLNTNLESQSWEKIPEKLRLIIGYTFLGLIFFLAGSFAITKIFIPKKVIPVLEVEASNVISIKVEPQELRTVKNLVDAPVIISSKETISEICSALNNAKKISPNHPVSIWGCVVTLATKNGEYSFKLTNCKNQERNGVILKFYTNKTFGWKLDSYRMDDLGTIIEKVVNQKKI